MEELDKRLTRMIQFGKNSTMREFLLKHLGYDLVEVAHCFQKAYGRPMIVEDLELMEDVI